MYLLLYFCFILFTVQLLLGILKGKNLQMLRFLKFANDAIQGTCRYFAVPKFFTVQKRGNLSSGFDPSILRQSVI
jgi:hypothetical protein